MHANHAQIFKLAAYDIDFLRKIRRRLLQFDPRCDIFLFGSRARHDNRFDSDYDILVLSDIFGEMASEERWRWFHRHIVLDQDDAVLQPQLWTPCEWSEKAGSLLYDEVMRDRIALSDLS
jgi:hypothetical protein